MKRRFIGAEKIFALNFLMGIFVSIAGADVFSLTGRILEQETYRSIELATISLLETDQRTRSDQFGRFAFKSIPPGVYTLSVHHIAYADFERTVVVDSGQPDSITVLLVSSLLPSDVVIVRSTRSMSVLGNTPYSVELKAHDAMKVRPAITVSDALKDVPGVSLSRDGSWPTSVSIRGTGQSGFISLVDHTRIEASNDIAGTLSLISVEDLERVEVMKSSGSVLYGSGALGGVVHLVTKRPAFTDQQQLGVELTTGVTSVDGGSSHHVALEGSTGRYAMRLSGSYRRAGNTMTPEGPLLNSFYNDFSLSCSAVVRTFEEQSLSVSYQRSQAEDTGLPGGAPIGSSAAAYFPLARREFLGIEYSVPFVARGVPQLTFRMSRQRIVRNVEVIQSPAVTLTPHATHTTTSAQMEAKLLPRADHLLIVGTEVWQRDLDSRRERYNVTSQQIIGERPLPKSSYVSGGIYAQDEWTFDHDRALLALGARYDRIHVGNERTVNPEYVITAGSIQMPDQPLVWSEASADDGSWSANAGLHYGLAPSFDVKFLVATAFRSPSLEERYQLIDLGNLVRLGNPALKPERSVCFNFGSSLHADGLKIQTNMFFNRLARLITEVPGEYEGRPAYIKTNIGTARLYGIEISGERRLSTTAALKSSFSWIRGEDTYAHADLPQIAPLHGQLEASRWLPDWGTFRVTLSAAFAQNHTALLEPRTPGYTVFDIDFASVPVMFGGATCTVRCGVENIFDHAYRNHLSTLRGLIKLEPGRDFFFSTTVSI